MRVPENGKKGHAGEGCPEFDDLLRRALAGAAAAAGFRRSLRDELVRMHPHARERAETTRTAGPGSVAARSGGERRRGEVRTSFDWKPTRRTLTRVAAGFAVVLVVVTGVFSYRSCLPGVIFEDGRALAATLEPSARDSLGVAPDSIFVLTLEEPVPLGAVKRALSIEPEVEFTVVEAEGGEGKVFEIRPEEPLEPNGIYRVQLALAGSDEPGYSWAYQVRGDLRVISTLPGHRSPGVPVRTGIELEFSHDGVNDPSDFFTIDPFVPGTWERHRRTWVFVPAVALDPGTIYTCTLEAGLGAEGTDQVLAGDYVFLFETEPAGSEAGGGFYFYVHDETGEFVPGQSPYFSVSYSDFGRGDAKGRVPAVSARVYCYADAAAFVSALSERDRVPWWAHEARESYEPSTVGLDRVLEAELEIQSLEWRNYLVLPEPLPEGFYLAFFRLEDVTRRDPLRLVPGHRPLRLHHRRRR